MKFVKLLSLVSMPLVLGLNINIASASVSDSVCEGDALVQDIGWGVNKKALKILSQKRYNKLALKMPGSKIVAKIERTIKNQNKRPGGGLNPNSLAKMIYATAAAYGVDPFVLTAIVWKESAFNVGIKGAGRDSGLTQITPIAAAEVSDQYRSAGPGKVYQAMSAKLFGNGKALRSWLAFAKAPVAKSETRKGGKGFKKGPTFRKNAKYALATGASLLKLYLALSNGNYSKAVVRYNGGGDPYYLNGNKKKEGFNTKLGRVHKAGMSCGDKVNSVFDVLDMACAVEGTVEGCESISDMILEEEVETISI